MIRRRRMTLRKRGFTLVELMVALVAGLIIAIAAIALSRTATNTFHEQVRLATVEASLRSAAERLRNDLLRASFMGTGNVKLDPRIARPVGNLNASGARYPSMANLQGLRILYQGSPAATHPILTGNNLNPDAVEITGNLTTDDSYNMQWFQTTGCGPYLRQKPDADSSVRRLVGGNGWAGQPAATIDALVKAAFLPKTGATFWARVGDPKGCFHYVEICDAGYNAADGVMFVNVKSVASGSDDGILTTTQTDTACGGNQTGDEFQVSPLTRVRWSVAASADTRLQPTTALEAATDKFNLQREILDASGTPISPLPEIVSEWAVDLKFGVISTDRTQPEGSRVVTYDMDPPSNKASTLGTPQASTTTAGGVGPQSVRAVRYRLSVRSATPEKGRYLSVFPTATADNQPYVVRYCVDNAFPKETACTRFARVRTLVSEVALLNQGRFDY